MLDQSHNVTDPIESLMTSATHRAALLCAGSVGRPHRVDGLPGHGDDVLMAAQTLKQAFHTDVTPLLQKIRMEAGGAADPVIAYRASGYRKQMAAIRPARRPEQRHCLSEIAWAMSHSPSNPVHTPKELCSRYRDRP